MRRNAASQLASMVPEDRRGIPEVWVASSAKVASVISRPSACSPSTSETVVSRATSPRSTASARSAPVKVLVTEPISNSVDSVAPNPPKRTAPLLSSTATATRR